jgi:hypothetical protein
VFGDVDGELLVGVDTSESDFLSDDHDGATVEARRCTVTGSTEGRGGGPAGRAPRSLRAGHSSAGWAGCAPVRGCRGRRTSAWRPRCGC